MRPIKAGPEGSPAEILFREIRRWDAGAAANEVVVFRVFFFIHCMILFVVPPRKGYVALKSSRLNNELNCGWNCAKQI